MFGCFDVFFNGMCRRVDALTSLSFSLVDALMFPLFFSWCNYSEPSKTHVEPELKAFRPDTDQDRGS